LREQPIYHKDLLPVNYVVADMAGRVDSPLYGMFSMRGGVTGIATPGGGSLAEYFIRPPDDPYRDYAIKWDGESQITYETFRDLGAAYAVGLVLIYLLVVAHFGSYLTPLIIMAPIPLTDHRCDARSCPAWRAVHGDQPDRNDRAGRDHRAQLDPAGGLHQHPGTRRRRFKEAVVRSAITRAQPIMLTGLAAMLGALFILDDPIFNGSPFR
jgi:multidrug efflux pump subunit AcrB